MMDTDLRFVLDTLTAKTGEKACRIQSIAVIRDGKRREIKLKSYYFTFGQGHVHSLGGFTYDKDIVVEVSADSNAEARAIMFNYFGRKWGMQYDKKPDMKYFPRGIKKI